MILTEMYKMQHFILYNPVQTTKYLFENTPYDFISETHEVRNK